MIETAPSTIITTTRFGKYEVNTDRLMTIPDGILGFETVHHFCLIDHAPGSPFRWLQALNDPSLAFVVIDPFIYFPDYEIIISDADEYALNVQDYSELSLLAIATIYDNDITLNLLGPIVVNTRTNIAKQIVTTNPLYKVRHSIIQRKKLVMN